eukprot:scaffold95535_cov52-Phaeocystis_antarctica.AAC.1
MAAGGGCHPTPAGRAAGCEVCVQGWFSGRLVPARATQEKMGHQPWPWPNIYILGSAPGRVCRDPSAVRPRGWAARWRARAASPPSRRRPKQPLSPPDDPAAQTVRPSPHRARPSTFAARLFAAAEHELDLDLDSEGPADAEDGSGGSEAGPSSVVDLSLLPLSALMRYVRHYSLSVPPECSKARLVTAVEEHFCSTVVDEARP